MKSGGSESMNDVRNTVSGGPESANGIRNILSEGSESMNDIPNLLSEGSENALQSHTCCPGPRKGYFDPKTGFPGARKVKMTCDS
jgi:hypothetical protein